MRTLYHFALSPACRAVRLALREKNLDCLLKPEPYWERREDFLALNPAGEVPVLIEEDGHVLADARAIVEYLDEAYPMPMLIGATPAERAETRRLAGWFEGKFAAEVTAHLLGEKVLRRYDGGGQPDSEAIRAGYANIGTHLDYIAFLTERRNWLAGPSFTLADIAAAAHLSTLDYLGDVPWPAHEGAREWYGRVKSRPAFRAILDDRVAGFVPPRHYADLDF
jgi:glutathione S-transferase